MSAFLDELFRLQPASALVCNDGSLVDVSAAAPPVAGYVLQAVDATHAIWVPATGVDATARAAAAAAQATANSATSTGSKLLKEIPTSQHADDVEFGATSTTGWDCRVDNNVSGGQAMTLGSSAPDPRAALSQGTGNVVFHSQRASWMHLQSWPTNIANNTNPALFCKAISAAVTNMFVWGRLGTMLSFAGTYDSAERFGLALAADSGGHPDTSNFVAVGLSSLSTARSILGWSTAARVRTDLSAAATGTSYTINSPAQPFEFFGIHKRGTAYDFWAFNDGLDRLYLGSLTNAFTPAWFGFTWTGSNASQSPGVPVHCADFVRRLDNISAFPF